MDKVYKITGKDLDWTTAEAETTELVIWYRFGPVTRRTVWSGTTGNTARATECIFSDDGRTIWPVLERTA